MSDGRHGGDASPSGDRGQVQVIRLVLICVALVTGVLLTTRTLAWWDAFGIFAFGATAFGVGYLTRELGGK